MSDQTHYLLLRIEALEKKVLELEKELHKSAMQILVNNPIFEQPIKK